MGGEAAIRDFVEAFFEVRDKQDTAAMLALMDPAFRFRICGTDRLDPFTRPASNPQEVRATVEALVGEWDLSALKNLSIHVDGDTAFVHRTGEVRHIPSGKVIKTELMDKMTVRHGRLVEYLQFVDTYLVAKTLGMA